MTMTEIKITTDQPPRQPTEFLARHIIDSGGPAIECQLCGRNHFDATGEFMDPGELGRWMKKHDLAPDKYLPRDGAVHWGVFMGLQIVPDCKCGLLGALEALLWRDRRELAKWLSERAVQEFRSAAMTKHLLEDLSEAIEPPTAPTAPRCGYQCTSEFDMVRRRCILKAGHDGVHEFATQPPLGVPPGEYYAPLPRNQRVDDSLPKREEIHPHDYAGGMGSPGPAEEPQPKHPRDLPGARQILPCGPDCKQLACDCEYGKALRLF